MKIRESTWKEALDLYLECRGFRDGVTMTQKGDWYAAVEGGALVGIVSTQQLGRWTRVKTLFIRPSHRRMGVATALVQYVGEGRDRMTAFAFDASRPVFEACGFIHERTGRNGVHFMRKSP